MLTDPIGDFLARIRNAQMARHERLVSPTSKVRTAIASILKDEGYIQNFSTEQGSRGLEITVELKYDGEGFPVIDNMKRISKPGLRIYKGAKELDKVRGGLGMAIISTSKGIVTDAVAREQNVGGEVLCHIW